MYIGEYEEHTLLKDPTHGAPTDGIFISDGRKGFEPVIYVLYIVIVIVVSILSALLYDYRYRQI